MTYELSYSGVFQDDVKKLCGKNVALREAVSKKLLQMKEFPQRFKPLRAPLQNQRRVHVLKSFALTYEIDEPTKTVKLLKLKHHDKAYQL